MNNYFIKIYIKKKTENINIIIKRINVGKIIISTTDPYGKISGGIANEFKWLKQISFENWEYIGNNLWKLMK